MSNFRKTPSPAEFFGYVFYFAGVIVGPAFFYRDYIEFITGENMKCGSIVSKVGGNTASSLSQTYYIIKMTVPPVPRHQL